MLVANFIMGQSYQEFPYADGYWKVQFGFVDCLDIHFLNDICSEYQYIVTGDTIINSELYHKLSYSGHNRNPVDESWTYWDLGYYGCYRNDAAHKKVYFIARDSINEVLLYDFNLNLNDTLPETFVYHRAEYTIITVDQIDSIRINNRYLKRYHLDNAGFGNQYLIEGIGSTLGLFSPITPFFEQHFDLMCFKNEAEELIFPGEYYGNCDLIDDISDNSFSTNYFNIFPNPYSTTLTVELPSNTSIRNTTLTVYNLTGQQILKYTVSEPLTSVDLSGLNAGTYLVKVVSGENVKVGKFVKQ